MPSVRPPAWGCSYIKEIKGTNYTFPFTFFSHSQNSYPNRFFFFNSRLLSRCRVLPLDHLWQALLITFDPTNSVPPTCRTKQQWRTMNVAHCLVHLKFKDRPLFVCRVTQTSAHSYDFCLLMIAEIETTVVHAWGKEGHSPLDKDWGFAFFLFCSPALAQIPKNKANKTQRNITPVFWENCSDSWPLD